MSYSKSIYFIPVWFDDFSLFTKELSQSGLWSDASEGKYIPRYLMNYATRVAQNKNLYRCFELDKEFYPNIYMHEDVFNFENIPQIEEIRFSCFSTGVGFMEFWVSYKDMTPEEIANFAYRFKKAAKKSDEILIEGKVSLYDAAQSVLPEKANADLFFSAMAPFKYECKSFHFLHIDGDSVSIDEENRRLKLLGRSYNTDFNMSSDSNYDMLYKPSSKDQWGGSSEGFVNITYDTENGNNYYLHEIKESHLAIDYYFMFLLLLNQRFASIQYIYNVSTALEKSNKEIEMLNKRIVELKTIFSFNVISDDMIFQNLYSKMYSIFEIKKLLDDLIDNESQMEILQNAGSLKTEKNSNKFLLGISILSLFSALIDASSYFDRFNFLQPFATNLGLICVCAIVILCLFLIFRKQ